MRLLCKNDTDAALTKEKKYLVYAMEINQQGLWYYIIDDKHERVSGCPFWNPYSSHLFNIDSHNISRYWVFNDYKDAEDSSYNKKIFAIPEWAIFPVSFYTKLVDEEPEAIEIFKKYKLKMELEFSDSDVQNTGIALSEKWVQCSICNEAWGNESELAMLVCPFCKTFMHNPRYNKSACSDVIANEK